MSCSADKEPVTRRRRKAKPRTKSKAGPNPTLPDPDTIIEEKQLTSPKGRTYRVIVTDQVDGYEEPKRPPKKRRK